MWITVNITSEHELTKLHNIFGVKANLLDYVSNNHLLCLSGSLNSHTETICFRRDVKLQTSEYHY